jgi:fucokinase
MMTTGGGWQDQVGGLLPGFKLASSRPQLPLEVDWRLLGRTDEAANDFLNQVDERLILVYTGQTRLARNLLQSVIRNWYSGALNEIFDELESNAIEASQAIEQSQFIIR